MCQRNYVAFTRTRFQAEWAQVVGIYLRGAIVSNIYLKKGMIIRGNTVNFDHNFFLMFLFVLFRSVCFSCLYFLCSVGQNRWPFLDESDLGMRAW